MVYQTAYLTMVSVFAGIMIALLLCRAKPAPDGLLQTLLQIILACVGGMVALWLLGG